jgi:hypothetical protein
MTAERLPPAPPLTREALNCQMSVPTRASDTAATTNAPIPPSPAPTNPRVDAIQRLSDRHKDTPTNQRRMAWHIHGPVMAAVATTRGFSDPRSCVGLLYVQNGKLQFESVDSTDGQKHAFTFESSGIAEIKNNMMPIGKFNALHVNTLDKQNLNFALHGDPLPFIADVKTALNLK